MSFHKVSLLLLEKLLLVLTKDHSFILFNHFDSCIFNGFTNKDLKDWFNFIFVIKKIWISIEYLSYFVITLWIWNENSIWWSINEVVWLQLKLINHVLVIRELFPKVSTLHLSHLKVLMVLLHLLMSHVLLGTSHSHVILPLTKEGFLHLLLFNESWVWLHVDWDNQSSKGVTTDNTTIIHDVLRGHLPII